MILEGVLTTTNPDGSANIAPMGALLESAAMPPDAIVLRPFNTSTTYANLKRTGQAVFHVTDDVQLLAEAAINRIEETPPLEPAKGVEGWILCGACRWYALRLERLDDRQPRADAAMRVVDHGRLRDYFGLCRASHAVVEAAILATRVSLLPAAEIRQQMDRLAVLVEKTGGPRHHAAWKLLEAFIRDAMGVSS